MYLYSLLSKLLKMKLQHIKPYLFILTFFLIPLLFIPLLKNIKNNSAEENLPQPTQTVNTSSTKFGLAIHGGAGNITPEQFTADEEAKYKAKLYEAVQLGIGMINQGDSAINVVVEVIKVLEDSPLFNAGKGAVFTNEGENELDASIMNGANKQAGAVAGVTTIKNPIEAAWAVMEQSKHVMLAGKGAEKFAKQQGLTLVDQKYFFTEKRWNSLQKALEEANKTEKHGTVGCVVLDKYGNLAAGTSTGGMTNKMYGRIGDSPIIGAGTYADNNTCAVSATGHGEFFIRYNVAYDIAARMKYLNESVEKSAQTVILNLKNEQGFGGVICIDKNGNISMPYNTKGMFRAYCKSGEEPQIFLY